MVEHLRANTIERKILAMSASVEARRPVLRRVLQEQGNKPLGEYAQQFRKKASEAIQPRGDYVTIVVRETQRLLGNEAAIKMQRRLTERVDINTPYHMGVDYHPLTVQSSLTFSLGEKPDSIIPAFAGGILPMNNRTYPLGILLSREEEKHVGTGQTKKGPVRINILPTKNGKNNTIVAMSQAFTAEMIDAARKRAGGLFGNGRISRTERNTIGYLLREVYTDTNVLAQTSYADQATIVNYKMWKRLFAENIQQQIPDLAFLQLENVSIPLIQGDLQNPDTLLYRMLFDPSLRRELLINSQLDGTRGCWDSAKPNLGTMFFWAVDERGEAVSMHYKEETGQARLQGKDTQEIPLEPESIAEALEQKKIMPALFSSFSAISFARGNVAFGGFQQTDYLTAMRNGLSESLGRTGYVGWSEKVQQIPTDNYSCGMTTVVGRYDDNSIKPIGSVEIMSQYGLTGEQLDIIKRASVKDANLLALPDIYNIVCRPEARSPETETVTTQEIYDIYKPKIVELNCKK